jgi:hypothetical protein
MPTRIRNNDGELKEAQVTGSEEIIEILFAVSMERLIEAGAPSNTDRAD